MLLWTDLNNDKQPDLIVVGEWMPIKVFINQNGKLTDASSTYIHFASSGWWNRIYAADMDNDGDTDLIIGNCGLNTQFHVNEKEPMNLFITRTLIIMVLLIRYFVIILMVFLILLLHVMILQNNFPV